jgi:hypothetical protein
MAWNHRGVVWLADQEIARAIADYNDALKLSPRLAEAYGNRGLARLIPPWESAGALRPEKIGHPRRFAYHTAYVGVCLLSLLLRPVRPAADRSRGMGRQGPAEPRESAAGAPVRQI